MKFDDLNRYLLREIKINTGDVGNRYDNFVAERPNCISKIVFMLDNIFESTEQAKQAVIA